MLSQKMATTIGYYLAFIALGIAVSSLGPTLQDLADHTDVSLSDVSILITISATGFLLSNLFLVRLYDRLPGHWLMAAVLLATALMLGLIPLMPTLALLVVVFLVMGMVNCFVDVGGNTMLVWVHGENVGPFMNILHFTFGIGAFASPLIIDGVVRLDGDLRAIYWVLALLMLPPALWLIRLESPQPQNGHTDEDQTPVNINYKLVLLIALFFFLHVAAELSYGSLIFSYVTERDLGGESTGRLMTSMFWGALTVGRLVAVPLAIYFKPRVLLLADLIGWVVSIGLVLVWTDLLAVWIASFGMGFSLASMFPMTIAFAERRIAITGRITGLFFVGGSLGSMSIPLIIGNLFESDDTSSNNPVSQVIGDLLPLQGPQYMMWIMLGLGVLALAVLTALVIYSPESSRLDAPTTEAVIASD